MDTGVKITFIKNGDYTPDQKEKLPPTEDLQIWKSFKTGSESAFIFIYEKYFKELFNYGCKFTADKNLVKDCIQDLFIELRNNCKNLGDTDSIKFYLYRCLRRRIVRELKKWYKFWDLVSQESTFEFHFSPEDILINRQINEENARKLERAIQTLSAKKKEAIYYFYYEGMSYEQIRQIMGFTQIKSTRNLIYHTLDQMRKAIDL